MQPIDAWQIFKGVLEVWLVMGLLGLLSILIIALIVTLIRDWW